MEPVYGPATNDNAGPPITDKALPEKLSTLSPPYSLPYIATSGNGNLPAMSVSEWKPSKEELNILLNGGSVYLAIYDKEHPMARVFAARENFDPT